MKTYKEIHSAMLEQINEIIKKKRYSQGDILKRCARAGYEISQSELSRILRGKVNLSLKHALALAAAFDVDLNKLVMGEEEYINVSHDKLVLDYKDGAYDGWRGKFYTIFMSTVDNEDKILQGELTFRQSRVNNSCEAYFKLDTGVYKDGQPIYKKYKGQACVSILMQGIYILLCGEETGELCFVLLRYKAFRVRDAKCRMGMVLTMSAGEPQVPTAHKIFLSRQQIVKDEMFEDIMPVLSHVGQKLVFMQEGIEKLRQEVKMGSLEKIVQILEVESEADVKEIECNEVIHKLSREKCSNMEIAKVLTQLMRLSINNSRFTIGQTEDNVVYDLLNYYELKEQ